MDLKSSWPKLLFAGLVAVVPAVLSYCKSSQEADHARVEANAGYQTLVQSVRNLELVVAAQSSAIGLLTNNHVNAGAGSTNLLPAARPRAATMQSPYPRRTFQSCRIARRRRCACRARSRRYRRTFHGCASSI